jgi:cell division protein FtsL
MTAMVKLGIGAVLTAAGLIVTFAAERQLIAERECVDCQDETTEPVADLETDIASFVEEAGND